MKKALKSLSQYTLLATAFAVGTAQAGYITGVTATTDITATGGTYNISHITDGSGLSTPGSFTATHGFPFVSTGWIGDSGSASGTITFDLHGSYTLTEMAVWNLFYYSGTPGVKDVSISTSTDGISYSPLSGGPTQFAYVSFATGSAGESAQYFTFGPVTASFVKFNIYNSWGSSTGLNEVAFGDTPAAAAVPEPASLALLAIGAAGFAARRRAA